MTMTNLKGAKFETPCARCGYRRGQHSDNTALPKLRCPGPWAAPQTYKRPSDKRKG